MLFWSRLNQLLSYLHHSSTVHSVLILLLILCCGPFLCVSSPLILSAYNKLLIADLFFPFRSQVKWAQPCLSITLITLLSTFRDCVITCVCVCLLVYCISHTINRLSFSYNRMIFLPFITLLNIYWAPIVSQALFWALAI